MMTKLVQPLNDNTTRWIIGLLISTIILLIGFYGTWTKDELTRVASAQMSFVTLESYRYQNEQNEKERRRNTEKIEELQKSINSTLIELLKKTNDIQIQIARIEAKN